MHLLERREDSGVSKSWVNVKASHLLVRSDNQFISHRIGAKEHLKSSGNELVIDFASAFRKVRLFLPSQLRPDKTCSRVAPSKKNMRNSISGTVIPAVYMYERHSTSESCFSYCESVH